MVIASNAYVSTCFWTCFSAWIQLWQLFHDRANHIWSFPQMHIFLYVSGTIFLYEFNRDICFMIELTIFGHCFKHTCFYMFLEPICLYKFNCDICFMIKLTIFGHCLKCICFYMFLQPLEIHILLHIGLFLATKC